MTWFVAILSLLGSIALLTRLALERPGRGVLGAARVVADVPPAADAARNELAQLVPSGDAIVSGPPPVDAAPLLEGVQPGVATSIDLSLVGVDDHREAMDRELWLRAKDALKRTTSKKPS